MLNIKNLKVSYHETDGAAALNGINLTVNKDEITAVIGESGAGKTTLGLSILGLVAGRCSGEINWQGKNLLAMAEEERRRLRGRDLAMVFQNIEAALHPLYPVLEQVMEAITVHGVVSRSAARERALQLTSKVGLDRRCAEAYPHQLSGGEKQRALIALALANDPEVMVLDEPTAALDALSRVEIIALLRETSGGKAVLLITHDISTAARLSASLAVLYAGKILEQGPTAELLSFPRHPYTRGLLRSYPNMTTTKDLQGIPGRTLPDLPGCPFHLRCTQKTALCESEAPQLLPQQGRLLACHRGGVLPLLEIKGLVQRFDRAEVLRGIDLTLYEGETLAVVGESGAGKSTLARTIMGLHRDHGGEIRLAGKRLTGRDRDFYAQAQIIFQNPGESINHRFNVCQAVKEPLDVQNRGSEAKKMERVRQVLEEVELPSDERFMQKYPHHLSGGELQRVAVARALVLGPKLLIADEPTAALDASIQAKILKLLLNLQEKKGLALMFITHDLALARKVSDRMAVMRHGAVVEQGPTSELISNPGHDYTRQLLQAAPSLTADQGASHISPPKL